jgi:hypothetical protein
MKAKGKLKKQYQLKRYEKEYNISLTTESILLMRENTLQGRYRSPLFSSCKKLRMNELGSDNNLQLLFTSFNRIALWWNMKQYVQ